MGLFLGLTIGGCGLFLASIFTRTGRRIWAGIGEGMSGIADAFDGMDFGGDGGGGDGGGDGGGGGD